MTATDLYHVGILVRDLDEGMRRFSTLLGLTFEVSRIVIVNTEESGQSHPRELKVTYSIEGPPFLELIESQEDGLWGAHHGEGLHHIGSWESDLGSRLAALADEGTPVEVKISVGDCLVAAYLDPGPVHNTRVELVAQRPPAENGAQL
jgi:hypothetical protein